MNKTRNKDSRMMFPENKQKIKRLETASSFAYKLYGFMLRA